MWKRIKWMVLPDVTFQPAFVWFLILFSFFQGALHLSSIFISLFLMNGQGDSLVSVCWFNGMNFLFTPVSYYIGGMLSKKTNMALQIRISMIALSVVYLSLILLGERATSTSMSGLLGGLNGFAGGFYYLAHVSMINQFNDRHTIDAGLNTTSLISAVEGITLPLLSGFLIAQIPGISGYFVVFACALLLMLGSFVISFRLPGGTEKKPYRLKPVFDVYRKHKSWQLMAVLDVLRGTREGGLAFLINVLLFISVRNELLISVNSTVCSLITIFLFGLVIKRIYADNRLKYYFYASMGGVIGCGLLFFNQGPAVLVAFSILNAIATNLTANTSTALEFDVINQWEHVLDYRQEALAVRESFVNGGRVISIVFLLWMEQQGVRSATSIAWFITVIYLIQFLLSFVLHRMEQELRETEQEFSLEKV